jgi:hypothetical protein
MLRHPQIAISIFGRGANRREAATPLRQIAATFCSIRYIRHGAPHQRNRRRPDGWQRGVVETGAPSHRGAAATAVTSRACERGARRAQSVATVHASDHDVVAAPFADGHLATAVSASISPVIVVTISPIVIIPIIIAGFALTPAVRSDTEIQLSERDRRLGRDRISSIFGECWEGPHCARDGDDKRHFSHANLLLCRHLQRCSTKKAAHLFVLCTRR